MTDRLEEIEKKLDTILYLIGHGSQKDRMLKSKDICRLLSINKSSFPRYVNELRPWGLKKVGHRWKISEKMLYKYLDSHDS